MLASTLALTLTLLNATLTSALTPHNTSSTEQIFSIQTSPPEPTSQQYTSLTTTEIPTAAPGYSVVVLTSTANPPIGTGSASTLTAVVVVGGAGTTTALSNATLSSSPSPKPSLAGAARVGQGMGAAAAVGAFVVAAWL